MDAVNSAPITRGQIVIVDDKRRWALVKLPRSAFPMDCVEGVEYVTEITLSSETRERVTHKAFSKIKPPHDSYGRPEPANGWMIVAGIGRIEDLLGKSHAIGAVSPFAPSDNEELNALVRP